MANIIHTYTSLKHLPANLSARFSASIESTTLVGPGSATVRFAKMQWLVIFWRCMILAEVAIMMVTCPSCYFPAEYAIVVIGLGVTHVLVFSWLRANTSLTSTLPFYIADFIFSISLMILSRDGSLIFVMSFYTTTSLFVRPITHYRQIGALSGLVGASFLLALYIAAPTHFSAASIADYTLVFAFFGISWVLICRLIDDAAKMEINIYIKEQRRSFIRLLHDDLGNTLCGLHFKIQSLFKKDWSELKKSMVSLERGYERAAGILDQILTGINTGEGRLSSIVELAGKAEKDFGIKVRLSGDTEIASLDPTIRMEILSILSEAVTNSAKHAGTDEVCIKLNRTRKLMEIIVSDQGRGFELRKQAVGLNEKDALHKGGYGLKNMKERASLIGGTLAITSQPDSGTSITLSLEKNKISQNPSNRLTRRLLDSDIYLVLLRIKLFVISITVIQFAISGAAIWTNPMAQLVVILTAAEAVAWYLFRVRLSVILSRRPWLLTLDILFFCLLFFISWRAGIPIFIAEPASYAIGMSAWFMGISRNILLSMIMGAGIIFASLMAPPDASMAINRQEEVLIEVLDNLILAALTGIVFDFIRNIHDLRASVIKSNLEQYRVAMSTKTHHGLYELLTNLKREAGNLLRSGNDGMSDDHHARLLVALETHSTMLKTRLREIMDSLNSPDPPLTSDNIKGQPAAESSAMDPSNKG